MWTIFRKETQGLLSSLIAYLVMAVFLTGVGAFLWIFPDTNVLDYGFADLDTLFYLAPYMFLFFIPAVTMRSFAEEKKSGTIELLFTRPLRDWEIIVGKYLSGLVLVLLVLLPTLFYVYSVYELGEPKGNLDLAGIMGSYLGLFLLGAVFTSIGIFASSLTENQITAFILAFFLCFVLFQGLGLLASLDDASGLSYQFIQLGIEYHYQSIRKGLIDSRDLAYFFSLIAAMLLATHWVLAARKA
ncbi:MAG: gliding motility-associated ABC transporter permease subunit GldF [Microscillaceae bacterium]|nr:gliding motility-associated ABC transporter permease subunit GldF [Microscillaceae bacterium]